MKPVTAPAEPVTTLGEILNDPRNREESTKIAREIADAAEIAKRSPAEPVAGETKPDKVQSALRGIRDIVKGRCNHLDLEVIREIINEAIGHEQV